MTTGRLANVMTVLVAIVALATFSTAAWAATTRYVDASAAGGDGSSWAQAYTNLQDAIGASSSGDEIWVAQGTYYPADSGAARREHQPSSCRPV